MGADIWNIMGNDACEMQHDGCFMYDQTWCMIHGGWGMVK